MSGIRAGNFAHECIKGSWIRSGPYSVRHQLLITELVGKIYPSVAEKGFLIQGPVVLEIDSENVFLPDLLFLRKEEAHRIEPYKIYGKANWVCEVLISETAYFDLKWKVQVYEATGVEEYWIIDPYDLETIGYQLVKGRFQKHFHGKGKLESDFLALSIVFGTVFSELSQEERGKNDENGI